MDRTSTPHLSRQVSALFHSMAHDLFGSYRPELHYMRGPGPKCREKRRLEAAQASAPAEPCVELARA
ncbi:MAG TPA: hypothetical protein VNR11_09380 [Xanthobacteraceae bacterium]|nr:hypothetical protein [Xanthobacteraceae bacterium]